MSKPHSTVCDGSCHVGHVFLRVPLETRFRVYAALVRDMLKIYYRHVKLALDFGTLLLQLRPV